MSSIFSPVALLVYGHFIQPLPPQQRGGQWGASQPLSPSARLRWMWREQPEHSLISCAPDNWNTRCYLMKLAVVTEAGKGRWEHML